MTSHCTWSLRFYVLLPEIGLQEIQLVLDLVFKGAAFAGLVLIDDNALVSFQVREHFIGKNMLGPSLSVSSGTLAGKPDIRIQENYRGLFCVHNHAVDPVSTKLLADSHRDVSKA